MTYAEEVTPVKLNAKSVLVGFGLGIIFSTSITLMLNSFKNDLSLPKQQLTDAEIIKRAKELGWVDPNEFMQVPNPEGLNQEITNEPINEVKEDTISITVKKNDSLETIIKKLKKAELIQDEKDFTSYISAKKMDKKIRTGTFTFKKGSDYETIVSILTKTKSSIPSQ